MDFVMENENFEWKVMKAIFLSLRKFRSYKILVEKISVRRNFGALSPPKLISTEIICT